jgi:hypothetical protein
MEKLSGIALDVRNALFKAASRTTGEQYIEPLIRERFGLIEPDGSDHDAAGSDGRLYEIKTSKVQHKTKNGKAARSLLERILFENTDLERPVPFAEAESADYDANIQNVKRDHFDTLIYVLLFADCIKVFSAETAQIATGIMPGWSDKHGRYDALGKSGQFMIKKGTIRYHLDNRLLETISYEEAAEIYAKLG